MYKSVAESVFAETERKGGAKQK